MNYFDTLRRNGWLVDPGEPVRVVAIHAGGCPGPSGGRCSCDPRLEMAVDPLTRDARLIESDLPTLDLASGE